MADMSDLLEDSALERLRAGGVQALTDLFMSHRAQLKRIVARRLDQRIVSRLDASDIVQDAFLRATRELHDYLSEPTIPPNVWLRILARRTVHEVHLRQLKTQKRDPDREHQGLARELSESLTDPDSKVARHELHERVTEYVAEMSELDRVILTLRHIDELTIREIAEELGVSVDTAKKRYVRALRRIRKAFRELNPKSESDQ